MTEPAPEEPAPSGGGRRPRLFVAIALALFAALTIPGAFADSETYDERVFFLYGWGVIAKADFSRDGTSNSKMPWNAVQAAPAYLFHWLGKIEAYRFDEVNGQRVFAPQPKALALARLVTVVSGLTLGLALAALARRVAGEGAMVGTLLLFAFDPQLLAHSRYVTTDVPSALATVLIVLASLEVAREPTPGRAAVLGLAIGAGLLVKYTIVHVVLGLGVAFAVHLATTREEPRPWKRWAVLAAILAVAAVLAIDAGYFFHGLPGHLPEKIQSGKLAAVERVIGSCPLPLSSWFWDGLDWVTADEERFPGPLTFLGELDREGKGSVFYYPVVFLFKTPLPLLILLGIATLGLAGRGPAARAPGPPRSAELVIGAIVVELFLYFVFLFRLQIGIRHLIPALALLLVPAGRALALLWGKGGRSRAFAGLLVAWQAASVLSFAPHLLPYVNELLPDRKLTYRLFADSNLDWGQARREAAMWVRDERRRGRAVHVDPEGPVAGTVVVSVNGLLGLVGNQPERFAWLKAKRPVSHIAYAYLVFEVRPDELPR